MQSKSESHSSSAIVTYGGGLSEPASTVLLRIARNVSAIYDRTFIGMYSFESLYTPEFIRTYGKDLIQEANKKRGTYFGTSRGIDLTDPELFKKAITCLEERNIRTIIVVGGDGSSRQVAETSEAFAKYGINMIFAIPLTLDGINGGLSIGINEATKESIREIENMSSAALQTRDSGKFGVAMVELQGRNRDDILGNVLEYFDNSGRVADYRIDDLTLRVVPVNFEPNVEKLLEDINTSTKRTLILVSEGAKEKNPRLSIYELSNEITRKVRTHIVGHSSQSNCMMSRADSWMYMDWIDNACAIIQQYPHDSFCIANNNSVFTKEPIDYYAKLNPREGQKPEISKKMKNIIKSYM